MKDNLIIYVSSRNNYDMLEGEVLKNINREGFEFINIDDNSCEEEKEKGKRICEENGIIFLENKDRGVQMATQTLIDFINEERPDCKFIFCFQHDIYPISERFFERLSNLIQTGNLREVGILGFNVIDDGDYTTPQSRQIAELGGTPKGMIGMAHLSIKSNTGRWLCPKQNNGLINNGEFDSPFICEFPMWAAVGINVDLWNEYIEASNNYHFHLWLPDIAMQFNYYNKPSLIIPFLYCYNDPPLKEKYNINKNSAQGAMQGNEYHFGEYSNMSFWKERWGWDYENVSLTFPQVKEVYKDTLIGQFYEHDMSKGPLKKLEHIL